MRFQCQNCQKILAIDDSECGQAVGCGHCGSITIVPQTRFSPNALINDFLIKSTLGNGAMGTVYLAHQMSLDRPVALKILMEQFAHNSEFIVDFVREARAAARLNHPNIVQSYAVGEDDGIYFFAMEYVEGKTLKTLLGEEKKLPWERAFTIVQQLAEALDFAWKNQQLVHRDIKPDNIMLTKRGVAKLADLGLARAAHETMDDDDEVMGTPQYICPEQLLGQPMDVRGDIYSLGATLFHALTGNFPFEGNSAAEIARKHLNAPVPDPCDYDKKMPASAGFVVKKMLAKRLEDRYEDAEELVVDIGFVLRGQSPAGFKPKNPAEKTPSGKTGKVPVGRGTKTNIKKSTIGGSKVSTGVFKAPSAPAPKKKQKTVTPSQSNPPKPPSSGDHSTMTNSSTGKVKSKTLKSTRMKTSTGKTGTQTSTSIPQTGTQTDAQTSGYRRPGAPPPKGGGNGGKILITMLVLFILAMIGCIAWFIVQYQKYNFKTTPLAKKCYLEEKVKPAQKEALTNVEIYFQGDYEDKDAKKVLDLANSYLETYPDCIYSQPVGSKPKLTQWIRWYRVPLELAMIAENIPRKASPLLGQVRYYRDNVFIPRYILEVRKEKIIEEDEVIAQNAAVYHFNKTKEAVWAELEEYAGAVVEQHFKQPAARLEAQMAENESKFTTEQQEVRKVIINETTSHNFDTAIKLTEDELTEPQTRAKYPVRVTVAANAAAKLDPLVVAKVKLNDFHRRFIPHKKGGQVTLDELKESFTNFIEQKGLDGARGRLRALPPKERALFNKRKNWMNNHISAIKTAIKYFDLVANTGNYFGEDWDKSRKRSNRRNIERYLTKNGYFARKVDQKQGDQIWIKSVSPISYTVQFRRYNSDGMVLPVGTEQIPHWEALNMDVFHYCAGYKKVKRKLADDFEHAKACFEALCRPTVFKAKHAEVSGANIALLKEEVDKILEAKAWEPAWATEYMDRMAKAIKRASGTQKKYLKDRVKEILGGTKAFEARAGEFN